MIFEDQEESEYCIRGRAHAEHDLDDPEGNLNFEEDQEEEAAMEEPQTKENADQPGGTEKFEEGITGAKPEAMTAKKEPYLADTIGGEMYWTSLREAEAEAEGTEVTRAVRNSAAYR
eukprot:16434013-Heterocapsa_arctica.AAC.1